MSKNYRVDFYRKDKESGEKEHLGFIYIDDSGVSESMTLHAKAWRLAHPNCLMANQLITTQL